MKLASVFACFVVLVFCAPCPEAQVLWDFSGSDAELDGWHSLHSLTPCKIQPGVGLLSKKTGRDPHLASGRIEINADKITHVTLRMKLEPEVKTERREGQLFWEIDGKGYREEQSMKFPVILDSEFHNYEIGLWENFDLSGTVTSVRLDPVDNWCEQPLTMTIEKLEMRALSEVELGEIENPIRVMTQSNQFSPNGDGINDRFTVRAALPAEGELIIRTEQGATLFEQTGRAFTFEWDGTLLNGSQCPFGRQVLSVGSPVAKGCTVEVSIEDIAPWPALPDPNWKELCPIGLWFDGRVEGYNVPEGCVNAPRDFDAFRAYYRKAFSDIVSKGITHVVIPNTPTAEYRRVLLEEAEKTNVQVILEIVEFVDFLRNKPADEAEAERLVKSVVEAHGNASALFAYQLIDEPPSSLYEKMKMLSRILGKYDPKHPSFSCLCVEWSVPHFVDTVGLPAVVFDRYTLVGEDDPSDWERLEQAVQSVKNAARTKPVWFVVQADGYPSRNFRFPTLEEVNREIDIVADNGCNGIFFFLYNSDTQGEHLQGLVDRDGSPTELWQQFDQVTEYATNRICGKE